MNLTSDCVPLIAEAIAGALSNRPELVGVSCLARGADSIFAEQVIKAGGWLEAVIPSSDYRARKVKPDHAAQFDRLVAQACLVEVMPFATANRESYEAANERLLACDELLAVWDGEGSAERGGTAAVVWMAKERGIPVTVIWPDGAARES